MIYKCLTRAGGEDKACLKENRDRERNGEVKKEDSAREDE